MNCNLGNVPSFEKAHIEAIVFEDPTHETVFGLNVFCFALTICTKFNCVLFLCIFHKQVSFCKIKRFVVRLNDVLTGLNPIEPCHQYRDKVCFYVQSAHQKTILPPPIKITGFTSGRGFFFLFRVLIKMCPLSIPLLSKSMICVDQRNRSTMLCCSHQKLCYYSCCITLSGNNI